MGRAQIAVGLSVILPSLARPGRARDHRHRRSRGTSGAVCRASPSGVEPSSIEKVRSVVTNDQGLYQIVDLRPGVYVVTFSLVGFAPLKREGVELSGSFTANVSAELKVGGLEESITVSADSPIVDIKNVVQQRVLPAEFRDLLPSGRSVQQMAQTLPGMVVAAGAGRPSGQDVGGVSAERNTLSIHGGGAFRMEVDGIPVHLNRGSGGFGYTLNPSEAQEFIYETSGISAKATWAVPSERDPEGRRQQLQRRVHVLLRERQVRERQPDAGPDRPGPHRPQQGAEGVRLQRLGRRSVQERQTLVLHLVPVLGTNGAHPEHVPRAGSAQLCVQPAAGRRRQCRPQPSRGLHHLVDLHQRAHHVAGHSPEQVHLCAHRAAA